MAKSTLQTVDRALQLLEILAEHPEGMQPKAFESILELNKVTVHRLLATLENRGFVERQGNVYKIGLKLVELSSIKLNNIELKTEAGPFLRKLVNALGLPVQMAILERSEAVFIEKVESITTFHMYSQIGKRIPLYASGVGKVLLMQQSDEQILKDLSKTSFQAFTDKTLTSPEDILAQIQLARTKGYAIDNEEHEKGIFCIAAPIYDYRGQIIAAISVGGREQSFIVDDTAEHFTLIKEIAGEISNRLGYMNH